MKDTIKKGSGNYSLAEIYLKYGMVFILVVLVVISSIASPAFLTTTNITNVIRYISIVALVAFGETMALVLGKIDLSSGSVMALTGCISCAIVSRTGNLAAAILAGALVGVLCGFINGLVISIFKIPAFIMTLAMMYIARGSALIFTNSTPISNMGEGFRFIGQGFIGFVPMPVLIMAVFLLLCWLLLNKTKLGRYIYACGGNEQAAVASGVNVTKTVTMTYAVIGIMTAVAGIVLMSRIDSGQPAGAVSYEMDGITAAIVGGTSLSGGLGTIQGTFVGCLIVGVLDNIMNLLAISSNWQMVARGLIIMIAVIIDVKTKSIVLNRKA